MVRQSSEIVEDLIDALEKMIDAQDDMWQEEKHCNYRQQNKIREERLVPAKAEFKDMLDEYIDRRIETYCDKYLIRRTKILNQVDVAEDI
jgi:hypothetical protein